LLFSLVNNFIKPFVVILVGQLLIRTMGFFLLVVNAAMFFVLIRFSPFAWDVQQPAWLWILVASSLLSLVVTLLDALFGLDQPQLDEEGRGQFIWQAIDRIPGLHKNELVENVRLQQVYQTIWRYGLDIALSPTPIGQIRNRVETFIAGHPDFLTGQSTPAKVRLLLQELGPTFVKFGQMVSSQTEALPAEWNIELVKLQNTVPPFFYEIARGIISQELGAPPEQLFVTFDPTPLAAASTAQIHRATLPAGQEVVVKVQRPNIIAKVTADLGVMTKLARVLESRFAWARQLNLRGIVEEFARGILKELDYQNEAFYARRLDTHMAAIPHVHVPIIYGARSAARVLTMEFIRGVKITQTAAIDEAGLDRNALAQTFLRTLVKQILIDGFFHGDLHPGNVLIDTSTGVIEFLDMGLMGTLRLDQRLDILDLLWSLTQGDAQGLATVALRLTEQAGKLDERAFRSDIERAYSQYWVYAEGQASFANMMRAILNILSAHGLRLNRDLTLAVKAIMQGEAIALTLNPQLLWVEVATKEATTLLGEEFTVERIMEMVKTQAIRTGKELIRQLPSLQDGTRKWFDQYRRGRLVVELDTSALAHNVKHFSHSMRRLTVALILVGMLIGSAIASSLLIALQDTRWAFLPIIAMGVFLGVILLSAVAVLRMPSVEHEEDK
jgi:ubiquinone biosynthesis protein